MATHDNPQLLKLRRPCDPVSNELELRDNWGGMLTCVHHWSGIFRSAAMAGYAHYDPLYWQTGDIFESSTYGAVNPM